MSWQTMVTKLISLTVEWTIRGTLWFLWVTRRLTIQLLPKPKTQQAIALNAGLALVGWVVVLALATFLLSRNPGGLLWGGVGGAVVGGYVGLGLVRNGQMQIAGGDDAIQLGSMRDRHGATAPVAIPRESRVRHVAVFGPTGSGKSTALKNMVLQDAAAAGNPGILCIDIKDDLALSLTEQIPAHRRGDILLFDPSDREHPPAFNPLADVGKDKTLVTAELLAAIKRLYGDSWGPRLEHVLRHVLLTLVETPDATLLDISRILTDDEYRAYALSHVTNFSVLEFWSQEYGAIVGKGGSLANVAAILNKLSVFSYPEVRNVIGQPSRGLDFERAMAEGQIVMAHLPQGVLGEDISHFFAALLVGKVQLAAQRRVRLAHGARRPFYVFADEFQNYDTSAFTKLITEGRSMGVGMVVACQFREQLPTELRLAVEKNCAYGLFCARTDKRHTIEVVKFQEPQAYTTLVTALPPAGNRNPGQGAEVRLQSRATLCQPRQAVEDAIAQRLRQQRAPVTTMTGTHTTVVILEEETVIEHQPSGTGSQPPAAVEGVVSAVNGHEGDGEFEIAECGACGNPVVASDAFCSSCGLGRRGQGRVTVVTTLVQQRLDGDLAMAECGACGAPVVTSDAFCAGCGAGFQPAQLTSASNAAHVNGTAKVPAQLSGRTEPL
jgi:hypothetical protein